MRRDATVERIISAVAPGTEFDETLLQSLLGARPRAAEVVQHVSSDDPQVVRTATLYLGLYGTLAECPVLALCLHHADARVVELAERGLWSIWMQSGGREGNRHLANAVQSLARGDGATAVRILSLLVATESNFAEAHFQLGLALSSLDRPDEAARAYRAALRLNPYHFAAAAALGHACIELGNLPAALRHYQQALRLHPRLPDLPQAVHEVETILARRAGH
ncbi:MAG: tetratricopeptide repeat protein [Planctomycetota bacterium]